MNTCCSTFNLAIENYWNYYLELERSFLETRRYVAFSPENYRTYSVEYLKLLEAACGEVDSIGKALASTVKPDFDDEQAGINKWWEIIQDAVAFRERFWDSGRECRSEGVRLNNCELYVIGLFPVRPWAGYRVENGLCRKKPDGGKSTPEWWDGYNTVKHRRAHLDMKTGRHNYSKANMGNVINSLAALYSLNNALLGEVGVGLELEKFKDDSVLFRERETLNAKCELLEYLDLQ